MRARRRGFKAEEDAGVKVAHPSKREK